MPQLLLIACVVSLLGFGCGKKSAPTPDVAPVAATPSAPVSEGGKPGSPPPAAAAVAQTDVAAVTADLTQALRKYSVEKRKVPASLNELVAAGYLPIVPKAPGGKSFVIDAKNLEVTVK